MTPDALHAHVVEQYASHINPYLAKLMNFAGFGVEIEAEGCVMRDAEGREFLDFLGGYGVFSLGHRHPRVVAAVREQLERMPLSGKTFFSRGQAELATRLAALSPEGLEFTFFSNSGAEAVEAAIKFAKGATGRPGIVSTHGGYHGKTLGALAATGRQKYRQAFEPLMPGVTFVPYGDAEAARAAMGPETAAVIVEAVQGEGGIHVPPPGYLRALREACDHAGALLIIDEVQTGLGRTGKMFACEHDGVSPHILTLAKCLGGGVMPIGATLFTKEVCDAVYSKNPLMHTSTFGGNPLACAAGLATLAVIEEEGLVERSAQLGERLIAGLKTAFAGCDLVSEVRGLGLMVGVEFAMDEVGELVIAQMVKRGVVAAYTLNNPRVIRLEPPLIVSEAQTEHAITVISEAVAETKEILAAFV